MSHSLPKLHNAMWPGLVGKGSPGAEPFIDLTNLHALGSDVQTGFVEQGLWSIALHPKFKDNRDRLAALWAFAWFLEETAQHRNSGCSEFLQ